VNDFRDHPTGLHIRVQHGADRCTITLTGELDAISGPRLAELLNTATTSGVRCIEVDLTHVSFVDLAGLRVLVAAHRRAAHRRVVLLLRHPQPHIRWLLQTTGAADRLLTDDIADGDVASGGALVTRGRHAPPLGTVPLSDDVRAAVARHAADERDRRADDRDLLDAERDRLLDERSSRIREHERWQDVREDLANLRERDLDRRENDQ
jgi:anti-sigma B factor antagonist